MTYLSFGRYANLPVDPHPSGKRPPSFAYPQVPDQDTSLAPVSTGATPGSLIASPGRGHLGRAKDPRLFRAGLTAGKIKEDDYMEHPEGRRLCLSSSQGGGEDRAVLLTEQMQAWAEELLAELKCRILASKAPLAKMLAVYRGCWET